MDLERHRGLAGQSQDGQDHILFSLQAVVLWKPLAEVLQGIRDEKQLAIVRRQFENLTYLEDDRSTFELGATICRELRRKGITIRNSVDCLISAVVIQHGVNFLENDRDYKFIDRHYLLNRI